MKHIVILLVLSLSTLSVSAQDFEKFTDLNSVNEVVITQDMFDLLSEVDLNSDDKDAQDFNKLVKEITEIRILSTKDEKVAKEMSLELQNSLKSSSIKELMHVKEKGHQIVFYAKPGKEKGKVNRLLMHINKEQGEVFLSIKGNIDLNEVAKLAKLFHFPGAKELKNIKSE